MVAKKKLKSGNKSNQSDNLKRQIGAFVLIALAVFAYAGIQAPAHTGLFGLVLNYLVRTLLGEAAQVLPFLLLVVAIGYLLSFKIENFRIRFIGFMIVFLLLAITLHLKLSLQEAQNVTSLKELYQTMFHLGLQQQGGGVVGAVLTIAFFFCFRDIGSYIVIITLGIVSLLLITNSSLSEIFSVVTRCFKPLFNYFQSFIKKINEKKTKGPHNKLENPKSPTQNSYQIKAYNNPEEIIEGEKEGAVQEPWQNPLEVTVVQKNKNNEGLEKLPLLEEDTPETDIETVPIPIEVDNKLINEYHLPPLDLLNKVNRLRDSQQQKVIKERAKALENTFESFGVNVKIKEVQAGPAVTRFEIQPDSGVKVSKILSLSDDLALNMAASNVRIEAPIPGKAAVGIEVPNKIVSLVYLREVLEDPSFKNSPSPLTIGLGMDITGVPVFADLLKMPHLLIAGSTGSGKSVCINTIIGSILFKAAPWEVKFLMIDPKIVELNIYNGIPHLISPVVTEPKKAAAALRSMVKEMIRRYDLFAREGVRDIVRYNEKITDYGDNREESPLPYIVILIDELADLMMVAPSEVEDSIVRLSQMSRAAGIHLVIATQRPSVDIITGLIKANITSRIAFAVSSQTDSRTILDLGGAEKLLGRGDMLYYPIGVHKPIRVQGAFVSEKDLSRVLEYIKRQQSPVYQQSFFTEEDGDEPFPEEEKQETDELLPEAVELIIQSGRASISLIQRRFRIGYARAARLIDDLEQLGIVGQYEGSKPRQVLMSLEQAKAVLEKNIK
ncbi:MAG: DNA translocase FtsK 4TM domain-containing protein [Dethiobacteria bacterium]|jgi:S-DNA-T family DNA segregation ATPase FtsK/SpoIIIE